MKETPLAEVHARLGARMIPFAGFSMPIQYASITAEHEAVRERAGIFDVSHMGEFTFEGRGALEAVQRVTVNDASVLAVDQAQYSAMVDVDGGILDDCVVYRVADQRYMMVVNASNIEKDWAHIATHCPGDVELRDRSVDTALIALQGPAASAILTPLVDFDLDDLRFYWKRDATLSEIRLIVSRTGYTGEDGFELYVPADGAVEVWRALERAGQTHGLTPCGLGARDTLRLEMGYALYGNDIDETTTPYEAGLGWIVKLDKGDFVGRDRLRAAKASGPTRRLAGFKLLERGIPRPGYPLVVADRPIAEVRSGAMSPTLGYGIGTAILPIEVLEPGTSIGVSIRDNIVPAEVVKLPFYTAGSLRR